MEQIAGLVLSGLSIIISIWALISSIKTGNKQVEIRELQAGLQKKQVEISELQSTLQEKQVAISQIQVDFQNKVELYLVIGTYAPSGIPAIFIRNAGNNVVYLTRYEFNGREYPQNNLVLPPMSICSDACYHIDLPTDGTPHASFKLKFKDWQKGKWQTTGYADFKDGVWELTYSPCERRKED